MQVYPQTGYSLLQMHEFLNINPLLSHQYEIILLSYSYLSAHKTNKNAYVIIVGV